MLAPLLHKTLLKVKSRIVQRTLKPPESLGLGASLSRKIVLHSLIDIEVPWSSKFLFFVSIFFMNFQQVGICANISANDMLIFSFLKTSKNFAYSLSNLFFCSLFENGISGTYTLARAISLTFGGTLFLFFQLLITYRRYLFICSNWSLSLPPPLGDWPSTSRVNGRKY